MSECKSCDAPVVWAKTIAGKSIPLDAAGPGTVQVFEDGNLEDTGRKVAGLRGTKVMVVRYVAPQPGRMRTHFVSCPNRDQHRSTR